MTRKNMLFPLLCLVLVAAWACRCSELEKTGKWSRFELTLHARFEGNPFTGVKLWAEFVSPEGRSFRVDGFYDGDGLGGTSGDVFKIRFMPSVTGIWSYRTFCNLSGMDGMRGRFECVESGNSGPLVRDPAHPWYLKWADGGYFFESGPNDPESFLADGFATTEQRLEAIDYLASAGCNVLYMGMVNAGPGDGGPEEKVTPWTGGFESPDFDNICLLFMNRAEKVFDRMLAHNVVIHLVFYLDDCCGISRAITPEQEEMWFRYTVARFGSYPNLIWNLAEEFEECFSVAWCEERAALLKSLDAIGHPVTVHQLSGDRFRLAGSGNFDLTAIQYNFTDPDSLNRMVLAVRDQVAASGRPVPVSVIEWTPLAPEQAETSRKGIWAIATGGGTFQVFNKEPGGSSLDFRKWEETWRYAAILKDCLESLPIQNMNPDNSLVSRGFCLAEPGRNYLIYQPEAATFTVDLTGARGGLYGSWLDPRSGARSAGVRIEGGRVHEFATPGDSDQVLIITDRL